jgi:Ca2+-binding RTX toxin-like protein
MATQTGTSAPDTLYGGAGDDFIQGLGGADQIGGYGGNDTLEGGLGSDTMAGHDGDNLLRGGVGDDHLYAVSSLDTDTTAGSNQVYGEDGDDWLYGGLGADTLDGGDGNDVIQNIGGRDSILGGAGSDNINAPLASVYVDGGDDADHIWLNPLRTGETLAGGAVFTGGAGDDTVESASLRNVRITLDGGTGVDTLRLDSTTLPAQQTRYAVYLNQAAPAGNAVIASGFEIAATASPATSTTTAPPALRPRPAAPTACTGGWVMTP